MCRAPSGGGAAHIFYGLIVRGLQVGAPPVGVQIPGDPILRVITQQPLIVIGTRLRPPALHPLKHNALPGIVRQRCPRHPGCKRHVAFLIHNLQLIPVYNTVTVPPPHVQIPSVFLYAYHITVHGVINIAANLFKSDDAGIAEKALWNEHPVGKNLLMPQDVQ